MKAIVVGAGIAGLVTARQLGLAGWSVDVVEKSPGPRPDGYMMDFFGPGVAASERIGLFPRLADVSYNVQAAEYVDEDERVTARIDYEQFARAAGGNVLSLLRPDMERVALEALEDVPAGRVHVHYAARVTEVHADTVTARVAVDGGPGELHGDVLIGADGIHSQVRAELFGPETGFVHPLGMRAAAFIADDPELHDRFSGRFVLTDSINRMAALYGLRSTQIAALLVYRDEAYAAPGDNEHPLGRAERLHSHFDGMSPITDRLLSLCPDDPYDDLVAQIVMPSWGRERAILVGDASGAVSLLAGQGGSLAIAGGARLGELLGRATSPNDIQPALTEFERTWRPVVEAAQRSGRRAASTFLPLNRRQLLLRRYILRAARLPGINRLLAHQIVKRIAS
ncbi:FAD-dependent monooxygenase [Leifsonia sp. 2MCAF36]|uniref:FAD-dependent monooxygenase n=1 Tax=Leifsonia sp. 2MCAF36 TaxID=3232988 RepID=UPI003F9C9D66